MYEELVDAVRGRVNRFVQNADTEDVLDPAGLAQVRGLLGITPRPKLARLRPIQQHRWREARRAAGLLHYARGVALRGVAGEEDRLAATALLDEVRSAYPDLEEDLRLIRKAPADTRFEAAADVSRLTFAGSPLREVDEVIAAIRLRLRSASTMDARRLRMDLATALMFRFGRTTGLDDVDAAVDAIKEAAQSTPPDDPAYPAIVSRWGHYLETRFAYRAQIADESPDFLAAVDATPEHRHGESAYLANVGMGHLFRLQAEQDADQLWRARQALQTAVDTPVDDPVEHAANLMSLAYVHAVLAELTGDFDFAITVGHQALRATPTELREHHERALVIASYHLSRAARTGDPTDVAAAHALASRVLDEAPAGHPVTELATAVINAADPRRRHG